MFLFFENLVYLDSVFIFPSSNSFQILLSFNKIKKKIKPQNSTLQNKQTKTKTKNTKQN